MHKIFSGSIITLLLTSTAEAALFGRLASPPGSTNYQAFYDDELDVTWVADASLVASKPFGVPAEEIYGDGKMNRSFSNDWIAGMNADGGTGYLGFNDWRLPTTIDIGNDGCNYDENGNFPFSGEDCGYNVDTSTSEMAHLFHDTLGNLAYYDTSGNPAQPGWGLTNPGPFSNIQSTLHWSGTDSVNPQPGNSWSFGIGGGLQVPNLNFRHFAAWALRTGDVAITDGDINLDGQVNAADILLAQRAIFRLTTLTNEQIAHADFRPGPDGDGILGFADLLLITKIALHTQ